MKLELDFYGCLCATSTFKINDINAHYEDFGDKYDYDMENAEEYGCGDMRFEEKRPTKEILEKYNITIEEYYKICDKLKEGLSFGNCGWCI